MEKKIAGYLREAERQVNNAKFIMGAVIGDCVIYERLKQMSEELMVMIESLED